MTGNWARGGFSKTAQWHAYASTRRDRQTLHESFNGISHMQGGEHIACVWHPVLAATSLQLVYSWQIQSDGYTECNLFLMCLECAMLIRMRTVCEVSLLHLMHHSTMSREALRPAKGLLADFAYIRPKLLVHVVHMRLHVTGSGELGSAVVTSVAHRLDGGARRLGDGRLREAQSWRRHGMPGRHSIRPGDACSGARGRRCGTRRWPALAAPLFTGSCAWLGGVARLFCGLASAVRLRGVWRGRLAAAGRRHTVAGRHVTAMR